MTKTIATVDVGNADIKAKAGASEFVFAHAIEKITMAEWKSIVAQSHGSPPHGYIRINDQAYAYGKLAEKRAVVQRRTGAARYIKGYYDILVAIALANLYRRGKRVFLFASHAPRDIAYSGEMLDAALGTYNVELEGRSATFYVDDGMSFDEPVGGLMNVVLSESGTSYARSDINGGDSLVIDIGGFTTDLLSVGVAGVIDYAVNESLEIGIRMVLDAFRRDLFGHYSELFKSSMAIPDHRLRDALRTGVYRGGGREYDCGDEANRASAMVLNQIADAYQSIAGGPQRWDTIVLTGGGSAALHDRLADILDHGNILLADDIDQLHLANVRGGMKLAKFYEAAGELD